MTAQAQALRQRSLAALIQQLAAQAMGFDAQDWEAAAAAMPQRPAEQAQQIEQASAAMYRAALQGARDFIDAELAALGE